jgi:hypothetical protein
MSNVIRLCDRERRVCTITPSVENPTDELLSLVESWGSITLSLEKLQDYLDQLRPALEALSDSPEKSHVNLLMKEAEVQIRDCRVRSIGADATVARALATTLTLPQRAKSGADDRLVVAD